MQRKLEWFALVMALLASDGCVLMNEQEGDQPPATGEYRVTVSPPVLTLTPDMANASLALGVSCAAVLPPANCDGNDPVWVAQNETFVTLTVANAHLPSTTVTLTADISKLNASQKLQSSLGFQPFEVCAIKPSNVPQGLHLTGKPYVDVNLNITPPGGDRTATNKPSLKAYPAINTIKRVGSTNAISFGVGFTYQGPADSVTFITKSGSNPDKFQVFGPPTPFGVSKTVSFTVNVVFVGVPATDLNTYSVDITALTDNLLAGVFEVTCGP